MIQINKDLEKLNQNLKDVYSIKFHTDLNRDTNKEGVLLIVRNHTRKDKLLALKKNPMKMKKELIIIVYKINIHNLSSADVAKTIHQLSETGLSKDDELKNNYYIRELYIPIIDQPTDIKIIYPIIDNSIESSELIKEISNLVEENDTGFKTEWLKLLRNIKMRKLEQC